ncbi:MAG: deoxyguanosinetriphosphate triphosphohydrolase [Thermanaerothrix sp.]|nr:deoxyguanosinetriphosphate triphosphohydrolase [Thermanaerothrix sp.]
MRRILERREEETLSPKACLASRSKGREVEEEPCGFRTCFQRDRDRIIHSKAFRRLKHKTQVLLLPEGDHIRTRLTHTLEVAQVARTISRALFLNEDLTEAIALGHDLGHTPFGHMGERVLNRLSQERGLGGFHHAPQSLRVVDHLERDGKGLNLTWEVRMGILQHSKGQVDVSKGFDLDDPSSMEAWVVRVSDSIAYLNHDLDDAIRAGFVRPEELPSGVARLGVKASKRIGAMVEDVIRQSKDRKDRIAFSSDMMAVMEELRVFLNEKLYRSRRVIEEEPKVEHLIRSLFQHFERSRADWDTQRIIDHISGMTDRYALLCFQRIAVPNPWGVSLEVI